MNIFLDEPEADSIPTSQATKSVYSNDSINTLLNHTETVQSDKPDDAVIAATPDSSADCDGNEKKKVSRDD